MNDFIAEILYIEWFNDFLTVARFAEYYNTTEADALQCLEHGRRINQQRALVAR